MHFVFSRMGWPQSKRSRTNYHAASVATQTQGTTARTQGATSQTLNATNQVESTTHQTLWLHAASVGEVKSITPLLEHISQAWPDLALHVTCTTPESFGLLQNSTIQQLTSEYCPIDFYRSTNALFKRLNPIALLVIETEIWPNLYRTANRHEVPLVIVNGRVSEKTLQAPKFVLNLYRELLPCVSLVLSRSDADSNNFKQLGIKDHQIKTIGNIKTYSGTSKQPLPIPELEGKRYLLAASTHAPEEQQLCDALSGTEIFLVIAPRHVQRSDNIQLMLSEKNISFATRSRNEPVTNTTRVYLADTTGEIDRLVTNAEMVFVGGSLIDNGGHNVLEPAAQGKPVITGPYYKNFIAEVDLLAAHNAISIVSSAQELVTVYTKLTANPQAIQAMGDSAKQAIESSKHVFDQYTSEIDQIIGSRYATAAAKRVAL